MEINIRENPNFVLLVSSKRKRYYIHSSGRVLSVDKRNKKSTIWLKCRNNNGTLSVRINKREFSVLKIMIQSFYVYFIQMYGNSYRVTFINGKKDDLRLKNLYIKFGAIEHDQEIS